MNRIVVDTKVFIGACLGSGATRTVVQSCLVGDYQAVLGNALFCEYEDVLSRKALFSKSRLSQFERDELFDIFLAHSERIRVYFQWRPNLRDEADNHLIELAVAARAKYVVTYNIRDFRNSQLLFPNLKVCTPEDLIKEPTQ